MQRLFSCSVDKRVLVWDVADGRDRLIQTVKLANGLYTLQVLPRRDLVFVSEIANNIVRFDLDPQRKTIREDTGRRTRASFHTYFDSSFQASGDGRQVYGFNDSGGGKCIQESFRTRKAHILCKGSSSEMRCFGFSEANRLLACAGVDSALGLLQVFSRKRLASLQSRLKGDLNTLRFSGRGSLLVVGSQSNSVWVFRLARGFPQVREFAFENNVFALTLNSSRNLVCVGGWSKTVEFFAIGD